MNTHEEKPKPEDLNMSCVYIIRSGLRLKKNPLHPKILNAQKLMSIQVHGLDSVLLITANPKLG